LMAMVVIFSLQLLLEQIIESGDTLRTSVLKRKVHPATDIGKFF
jgi:hypothetical protein